MGCFAEYFMLFLAITSTTSISTIHHDKPESVTLSTLSTKATTKPSLLFNNVTLNPNERRKRLLPYENFYLKQTFNKPLALVEQNGHSNHVGYPSHHQQFKEMVEGRVKLKKHHHRGQVDGLRANGKFTPFMESNALPGPFRPMIPQPRPIVPVRVEYVSMNPPPPPEQHLEQNKVADFSSIYDTLSQLKLRQQELKKPNQASYKIQRYHNPPRINYQQESYETDDPAVYKTIQPSKTYIETFTATNIDITAPGLQQEYAPQQSHRYHTQKTQPLEQIYRDQPTKTYAGQQITIEVPKSGYLVGYQQSQVPRKPKENTRNNNKPYVFVQKRPVGNKPQSALARKPKPVTVIDESNFVADKYVPYLPLRLNANAYQSKEPHYDSSPVPNYQNEYVPESRYPVTPKYRVKGTQQAPQSYQTIVQRPLQDDTPPKYFIKTKNREPESYNSYKVATPHPQYEIVTSRPLQSYKEGHKFMVVEINPESQSYKVVSPEPQIIEIITQESTPKYPAEQQYYYQTVTPAPVVSTNRPEVLEQHDVGEADIPRYHPRVVISTNRPEIEEQPQIEDEHLEIPPRYHQSGTTQEIDPEKYEPIRIIPTKHENIQISKYQVVEEPKYEQIEVPKYQTIDDPETNSNDLAHILKHLQETNTLPQTLTPDNIDNSIKTLVRILDELKSRQKQAKPMLYHEDQYHELENEAGVDLGGPDSDTDTPDGGTPGKPGVDYPALASIPPTSFSCKTQRYKGFFGDPDTNCQVWHYCDLNGGQASFLCPNGTIFSQVALTCDWWFNVKCASTPQLYVLNERLYKYIIPLAPKFPEDYSGPLVDKYLALKFQEMEEKLKKQKKGKGNKDSEEDESEEKTEEENNKNEESKEKEENIEEHLPSAEALVSEEQTTAQQEDFKN